MIVGQEAIVEGVLKVIIESGSGHAIDLKPVAVYPE